LATLGSGVLHYQRTTEPQRLGLLTSSTNVLFSSTTMLNRVPIMLIRGPSRSPLPVAFNFLHDVSRDDDVNSPRGASVSTSSKERLHLVWHKNDHVRSPAASGAKSSSVVVIEIGYSSKRLLATTDATRPDLVNIIECEL